MGLTVDQGSQFRRPWGTQISALLSSSAPPGVALCQAHTAFSPPHMATSSQALSLTMERRPQVWLGSCSLEVTHFILGASWTSQEHRS